MSYMQNRVQQDLLKAVDLYNRGALSEVQQLLLSILKRAPGNVIAMCFLLRVYCLDGKFEQTVQYLERVLAIGGLDAGSLSLIYDTIRDLYAKGQFDAMNRSTSALVKNRPQDGEAWNLHGACAMVFGKSHDAVDAFSKAVEIMPQRGELLVNLGGVLTEVDRPDEAIGRLELASKLADVEPIRHILFNNFGSAYRHKKDYDKAISYFEEALKIQADYPEALSNLGLIYSTIGKYEKAIEYLKRAVELQPRLFSVYSVLADSYKTVGRLKEAMETCEAALAIEVAQPYVWAALGDILRDANHIDESIQSYINSLHYRTPETERTSKRAYTSLLFTLNYHPDLPAEEIFQAYEEFHQRYCSHVDLSQVSFSNSLEPNRRLRVGYVCQTMCNQVCMHFLLPLVEFHDHNVVELFAYTDGERVDEVTDMYRKAFDHWVITKGLSDEELAQRIRQDQIDILIDVSGHTTDNRLLAFAHKPAPISLHWLEFGYTTGLKAIDYYLCDPPTIPLGSEHLFSEKPWYLDGVSYCYRPRADVGPVGDSPALRNSYVTLGTLSRSIRINYRVVRAWAAILHALPNARLVINSLDFRDEKAKEEMKLRFAALGIEQDRLEIGSTSPPWDLMRTIDIALDCFPHNSGTTLFEALYMGQPFVTLAGRPSVGRLGASVLHGLGRPEWIAESEQEYVEKVVALASDIPALAKIRAGLRDEMRASLLMNEPQFARSVERAYRQMWQKFCEEQA